jgi:hypothetical protein
MEMPSPTQSGTLQDRLDEATRFWEPRRLVYNFVLSAVALGWLVVGVAHFCVTLTLSLLLALAVLALLANICYCAAYFVDIPLQCSGINTIWRHRRWLLWLLGTIFAIALESYWINDEIFSSFRRSWKQLQLK